MVANRAERQCKQFFLFRSLIVIYGPNSMHDKTQCNAVCQRVQQLPREVENPTAHNSGYVYISRTPFDGGGPHTRRVDRAKWRTGNPQFIFDPSDPPGCLPPTCLDLFRQQQSPTLDRNLH